MGTILRVCKIGGLELPELLRQICSYLPELFGQFLSYFPELLWQIHSYLTELLWQITPFFKYTVLTFYNFLQIFFMMNRSIPNKKIALQI